MGTFLFDKIVFGPVYSRRLGQSLGLNLLPTGAKICSFDCVYCECGWTDAISGSFVDEHTFELALEDKLQKMKQLKEDCDAITFAGNGEPTLHPQFAQIANITTRLRDKYMPHAEIAVLSNSTTVGDPAIVSALLTIDRNIMKLDAGSEDMYQLINKPLGGITLQQIVDGLQAFRGNLTIQTLLLKGNYQGKIINNITENELKLLGKHLALIQPHTLMLYSIARGTPLETLQAVDAEEMNNAAVVLQSYVPECKILKF
jgi:wyosine [tRNA(Phe)-imidazoG37] synthetase (radical SAM superfamily)